MKNLIAAIFILPLTAIASNWDYSKQNGIALSMTGDKYNSFLGFACRTSKECFITIDLNLDCEAGEVYPALIGVDGLYGASQFICGKNGKILVMDNDHYNYYLKQLRTGRKISLVFGTSGNRFKSAHFSLNGSSFAIAKVISNAEPAATSNGNYL